MTKYLVFSSPFSEVLYMSEPFRTIGTSIASLCPAFERARCPSTESPPSLAPGGEGCRRGLPESIEMSDWMGRERSSVHQQDLVDPEAQFGGGIETLIGGSSLRPSSAADSKTSFAVQRTPAQPICQPALCPGTDQLHLPLLKSTE